jgi:hypothetical protein
VVKSDVRNTRPVAPKGTVPSAHAAHNASAERFVPAEIEKQKKSTADALKVIRNYVLPAGSPMAFSFKPLKAARGRAAR